jgi:23S rRNA-/tRNA-specific pseudouridylate synthase
MLLHHQVISFEHPVTGKKVTISATIPNSFSKMKELLQL